MIQAEARAPRRCGGPGAVQGPSPRVDPLVHPVSNYLTERELKGGWMVADIIMRRLSKRKQCGRCKQPQQQLPSCSSRDFKAPFFLFF